MKTAIVTGANGFIGSHIVYRLLVRGWRVHALGRGRGTSHWNDRVVAALREVGNPTDSHGELHCHEVELNAPDVRLDFLFCRDDSPAETTLFHPRPQANTELVNLICEVFKVKGKFVLEYLESIPRPMNHTEEMILRSLKPYAPYLNSHCEFDVSHARSVVPDYDDHFTQLDVPYIRKIVEQRRNNKRSRPSERWSRRCGPTRYGSAQLSV